ncbi:MAG TPA: exonuclease domain-containing protein [Gaiellaceae bacterium]|nr:exonuclease domain-containing protein [Gaiellaceae bacterium]
MLLSLDSLDRLVSLVVDRGGSVSASEAASHLLAMPAPLEDVAIEILGPLVEHDARLAWRQTAITLDRERPLPLEDACFVVFDLETTGLATANAAICEIGAVRIRRAAIEETFETLVAPSGIEPRHRGCLAGISEARLRAAPHVETALRSLSTFAEGSILVAHNARFDVAFVNRELTRLSGTRLAGTVIDTLPLARNLLRGRIERTNLASLAFFFGVSVEPRHRALPDAQATSEVFLSLLELARERGATTVADLAELATPKSRLQGRDQTVVAGR